jgi:hypothetical protein
MVTRVAFNDRSRRGDEAEGFGFHWKSGSSRRRLHGRRSGVLMAELLIAMAMMVGVLLPLAYSITSEKRLARTAYQRSVAMEIVDGEMEILAAGEWRSFGQGQHEYPIHALAATNLPPGPFLLTVGAEQLRLEWKPNAKKYGGAVVFREAKIK